MKFVCSVCGYVHEGDSAPEVCPICKAPADKFIAQKDDGVWAAEHVVGVAKGVPEDILKDLRANFEGECTEVGMYLAMSRVAHREGYPEIGLYWEKAALEEAEHAAKFAELLGEVVTDSTARPRARLFLRRERRKKDLTRSTIPYMRWHVTKPATARLSRDCSRDISAEAVRALTMRRIIRTLR